jgi:hypothetical protein
VPNGNTEVRLRHRRQQSNVYGYDSVSPFYLSRIVVPCKTDSYWQNTTCQNALCRVDRPPRSAPSTLLDRNTFTPCRSASSTHFKNNRSYLNTSTLCSQLFTVRVRLTRTPKSTESTRVRNIRCRPKISVSLRNSGFYGKTKFLQSMVTVHYWRAIN